VNSVFSKLNWFLLRRFWSQIHDHKSRYLARPSVLDSSSPTALHPLLQFAVLYFIKAENAFHKTTLPWTDFSLVTFSFELWAAWDEISRRNFLQHSPVNNNSLSLCSLSLFKIRLLRRWSHCLRARLNGRDRPQKVSKEFQAEMPRQRLPYTEENIVVYFAPDGLKLRNSSNFRIVHWGFRDRQWLGAWHESIGRGEFETYLMVIQISISSFAPSQLSEGLTLSRIFLHQLHKFLTKTISAASKFDWKLCQLTPSWLRF
jgi:hypothetical protein